LVAKTKTMAGRTRSLRNSIVGKTCSVGLWPSAWLREA